MNPLDYLHFQLRLEGKQVVDGDQLRQVEIVPDEEMPLMLIAQLTNGQVVAYYDESLNPALQKELAKRFQQVKFPKIGPLLEFLGPQNISFEVGHFKTYLFPAHAVDFHSDDVKCLSNYETTVQEFGFGDFAEKVYVIERDGKVVSACVSTRENDHCGEAWVYTDERFRRQGFAQQVVHAWARDIVELGKVPFYSHAIQNVASANLARRIGTEPVFEEVVISYLNV